MQIKYKSHPENRGMLVTIVQYGQPMENCFCIEADNVVDSTYGEFSLTMKEPIAILLSFNLI